MDWIRSACLGLALAAPPAGAMAQEAAPARTWPAAASPAVALLFDSCPMSTAGARMESAGAAVAAEAAASVLATVAGVAVERAFEIAGRYLEQFADSYGASSTASGRGPLLRFAGERVEPDAGCLVFLRGRLTSMDLDADAPVLGLAPSQSAWKTPLDDLNTRLRQAARAARRDTALQVLGVPEVYAEFSLYYRQFTLAGPAGEAAQPLLGHVGLSPVVVFFGQSGAQRGRNDAKSLVFQVAMSSLAPGAARPVTLLAEVFDLGRLAAPAAACRAGALATNIREIMNCRREILHEPEFHPLLAGGHVAVPRIDAAGATTRLVVQDPVNLRVEVTLTEAQQSGDFIRAIGEALRRDQLSNDVSARLGEALRGMLTGPR
ncbi:hypothetical protein [Falsiroseomonas selenitidurans]|uniref:Uncharacterized protein n=1 Tax=Falsiroseomonas selenitidurans TaxID=2716335 RepID=A0ABX1E209_9PROT|nr:hypothetical protein [Falsiroseomonas selenitidurans]NKC31187.1 hypothetical protein [Falsiroseomonas selenitidurans]